MNVCELNACTVDLVNRVAAENGEHVNTTIHAHALARWSEDERVYSVDVSSGDHRDLNMNSAYLFCVLDQLFRWGDCPKTLGHFMDCSFVQDVMPFFWHRAQMSIRRSKNESKIHEIGCTDVHETCDFDSKSPFWNKAGKIGHKSTGRIVKNMRDEYPFMCETVNALMFGACNTAALIAPLDICPVKTYGSKVFKHGELSFTFDIRDARTEQTFRAVLSESQMKTLRELVAINVDSCPDTWKFICLRTEDRYVDRCPETGEPVFLSEPLSIVKGFNRNVPTGHRNTLISAMLMVAYNYMRTEFVQSTTVHPLSRTDENEIHRREQEFKFMEELDEYLIKMNSCQPPVFSELHMQLWDAVQMFPDKDEWREQKDYFDFLRCSHMSNSEFFRHRGDMFTKVKDLWMGRKK